MITWKKMKEKALLRALIQVNRKEKRERKSKRQKKVVIEGV
jgi:hypothetical protein